MGVRAPKWQEAAPAVCSEQQGCTWTHTTAVWCCGVVLLFLQERERLAEHVHMAASKANEAATSARALAEGASSAAATAVSHATQSGAVAAEAAACVADIAVSLEVAQQHHESLTRRVDSLAARPSLPGQRPYPSAARMPAHKPYFTSHDQHLQADMMAWFRQQRATGMSGSSGDTDAAVAATAGTEESTALVPVSQPATSAQGNGSAHDAALTPGVVTQLLCGVGGIGKTTAVAECVVLACCGCVRCSFLVVWWCS